MPVLLTTAYFPPVSYFAAMAFEMGGLQNIKGGDRSEILSSPLIPSAVYIEACENFQKQSYRTRCRIYAADGVQDLSVPVIHEGSGHAMPIASVKVDYSKDWLLRHKRAIVSAYRTSAYFDYYEDELFAILDSRPQTLLELNTEILKFFVRKTGLAVDLRMTEDYSPDGIVSGETFCRPSGDTSDSICNGLSGKISDSISDGLCDNVPGGMSGSVSCRDLRSSIHPKRPDTLLADMGLEKPYFQVFSPKYGFKSNLSIMDLLFNEGPDSILYLYSVS